MDKDYVVAIDKITKRLESREFHEGYHSEKAKSETLREKGGFETNLDIRYQKAAQKTIHKNPGEVLPPYVRGEVLKTAHDLMAQGVKTGNLQNALKGAELYDGLGLADHESVSRRLVQAIEKNTLGANYDRAHIAIVRKFIVNHRKDAHQEKDSLEGRVAVISIGFILLVSFLSSQVSVTGYAVNAASSASTGLAGLFMFSFLILGIAYLFNKK